MKRSFALLPVALALTTFGGLTAAEADTYRGGPTAQLVHDDGYYNGGRPWWRHEHQWRRHEGWRRHWWGDRRFERDRDRYGWNDRRDWRDNGRWR